MPKVGDPQTELCNRGECHHLRRDHSDHIHGMCLIKACPCDKFEPSGWWLAPDVNPPTTPLMIALRARAEIVLLVCYPEAVVKSLDHRLAIDMANLIAQAVDRARST